MSMVSAFRFACGGVIGGTVAIAGKDIYTHALVRHEDKDKIDTRGK